MVSTKDLQHEAGCLISTRGRWWEIWGGKKATLLLPPNGESPHDACRFIIASARPYARVRAVPSAAPRMRATPLPQRLKQQSSNAWHTPAEQC